MGTQRQINCLACRYFYITYEPRNPYGCKALAFKSKDMPCRVVYVSSGMQCQSFAQKAPPSHSGGA